MDAEKSKKKEAREAIAKLMAVDPELKRHRVGQMGLKVSFTGHPTPARNRRRATRPKKGSKG